MSPAAPSDPRAAIEAALHALCARAGTSLGLGRLRLHLVPASHPFLRTVALPLPGRGGWPQALAALRAAARLLEAPARIELVAERWPEAGAALAANGFARTLAVPLLWWPAQAPVAAVAEPCRRLGPETPAELLAETLALQHAQFGEPPPSAAERAHLLACLAEGSVRTWLLVEDGRPVAAASLQGDALAAELVGLWTRPDRRRRGFARRVAAAALAAHDAEGGRLLWAGAASPASEALLRSLGLVRVGTLEAWAAIG
ncbi:MAG: GNAT family N-acetyltransferase [Geminicoccaceae bacterium]|nr:GNAT family N-acetyltransferase [Geminicoccaceae bacterium]